MSSGYNCCIGLDTIENISCLEGCGPCLYLWCQFYHPCKGGGCGSQVGIWTSHTVTQLEMHSLAEVHLLVEVACHHDILVFSVQSCLHLEHWESLAGQFVLPARCCHVQLGQSLEGVSGV